MSRARVSVFLAGAAMMLACASPRSFAMLVHRDQAGGVLALEGPDRTLARQDAEQQMRAHCDGPFEVIAEDRVAVGQQTRTDSITDVPFGYPGSWYPGVGYVGYPAGLAYAAAPPWTFQDTRTQTRTAPAYEYQLSYKCARQR